MRLWIHVFLVLFLSFGVLIAQDYQKDKMQYLEEKLRELMKDVETLKQELATERATTKTKLDQAVEERIAIMEEVEGLKKGNFLTLGSDSSWLKKFTIGGYGEMHLNMREGKENKFLDIHRFVLYLGYDFTDWIKLNSEIELEHAFVADGDGELQLEQLYVDFLFADYFNVRVGRVLIPMGITNKFHEPTTFYSVERPSVERDIIPTTWFADGAGVYGKITPYLRYEAYITNSLDGSKFTSTSGIRSGRQKERPGISEPGFSGRLDIYPLAGLDLADQDLRFGVSMFAGGMNNGDEGKNPDINGEVYLYSADVQYKFSKFDFRAVGAYGKIGAARELNDLFGKNVGSEIAGFYLEAAYHFWPDSWKTGKLENSDAVVFARYEDYNTQYKVHSGLTKDPKGNRNEWTFGVAFYPIPNLVLKMDYQLRDDATREKDLNFVNFGIGWDF